MKVTEYKYERVVSGERDVFIPEEPFYCFQTGIRRSIRMIPKKVTWDDSPHHKKGDIFQLDVTCVYQSFECVVEKFSIPISTIGDHLTKDKKGKVAEFCKMIIDEHYSKRTKEQFDQDLKMALDNINSTE